MRVLVTGGRDYADYARVEMTLDALHRERPFTVLIHGKAPGADMLAGIWGATRLGEDHVIIFPPDWIKYGRGAGPRRNQQMLDEGKPELVVAFPGGKGTADMVRRAHRAKIPVMTVSP